MKCHVCNELSNGSEKEKRRKAKKKCGKRKKRKEMYIGEEKREREKENLAHLVNLGGEYMGVHFTILATFL